MPKKNEFKREKGQDYIVRNMDYTMYRRLKILSARTDKPMRQIMMEALAIYITEEEEELDKKRKK